MLDAWFLPVLLLAVATGAASGYLAARGQSRALANRTYSLECDVADLQTKLLLEIKKRAAQEGVKARKVDAVDQQILDTLESKPVTSGVTEPWWSKYVAKGS